MRIKPWFSPHGTPGRTPVCTPSPPPTRSSPIALRMRYNPAPQPRRAPAQRRRAGCMDALAQTLRAWDADAPLPLLALQTYARGWHLIPPSHALTPICRRRVHPHPRPCDNGDANRSIRHASFLLCADSNAAGATKPMCKHIAPGCAGRRLSPLPSSVRSARWRAIRAPARQRADVIALTRTDADKCIVLTRVEVSPAGQYDVRANVLMTLFGITAARTGQRQRSSVHIADARK